MTALAPTLQAFFTDRLITQRHASPHTIRSYRDTMRLLLEFAHHQLRVQPAELDIAALDADLIAAFLDHLEHERKNTIGTRNTRLAAIHSLYKFASLRHPEHAAVIARVLAIPPKRHDRRLITHLDENEIEALLAAPDPNTWIGRRDRAMFPLAIETGLRVSELTGLTSRRHPPSHPGARRLPRQRTQTPHHPAHQANHQPPTWMARRARRPPRRPAVPDQPRRPADPRRRRSAPHPPHRHRRPRLPATARQDDHPTRPAPHRRDAPPAAGVDTAVIALWLGHEQVDTTQIYLHADMAIKERALALTKPTPPSPAATSRPTSSSPSSTA